MAISLSKARLAGWLSPWSS